MENTDTDLINKCGTKKNNKVPNDRICKHFVIKKKRFCKMLVSKGSIYCGEHLFFSDSTKDLLRIPCPLDNKHTVFKFNLQKHLKICNARQQINLPYISTDINAGSESDTDETISKDIKLSDIPEKDLLILVEKVETLFVNLNLSLIGENIFSHDILMDELHKENYGKKALKHLIQISSILGCFENSGFLKNETSFIEFGAGKGQVSYWIAKLMESKGISANIVLLDRASHRHKKENKLENTTKTHRIRSDIKDFNLNDLDILKESKHIVAVGKHLCGSATDLALRCLLKKKVSGFFFAICCHHRCNWKSFVGKHFFKDNQLSKSDFLVMCKLVSWATCGSREHQEEHKEINTESLNYIGSMSIEKREEIGKKCKRILDFSRKVFMESKGFDCSLHFYVKSHVTLENLCFVGLRNENV